MTNNGASPIALGQGRSPATASQAAPVAAPSENALEKPRKVSYLALFKHADRLDSFCIFFGVVGTIINGAGMPVFAIIFGNIINDLGINAQNPEELKKEVNSQVALFIYVGLACFVGGYCQGFFFAVSAVRQVNRMREIYLRRVLNQDIAYFDTTGTSGFLLQGLNEDCITIQAAIGEKLGMFVFFMSTAVVGIIIAFVRGWDMTLVILSLLPVLGVAGYSLMVVMSRLTAAMNRAYADANSLVQQALSNVRTVYAYNGEERTVQEYEIALQTPLKVGIKQGFMGAAVLGATDCIIFFGYALAMWYGGKRVADGDYTGGDVMNVLFAALIGGFALGQAAPNVQHFQQGATSGGRLFAIMDRQPAIDIHAPGKELGAIEGNVQFKNVAFAYPSRPDRPIFVDFSLVVPAGKTVALVGESGSGKSTVIQLIERFYDFQAGAVLLDGVDLRELSLKWLRSQMGLVSQQPTLFATTIRHNILLGKPKASTTEVISAAVAANAHTFISALPRGYDTHVGEKGLQMSGGQKQRIAIARALLNNPRVLLLDEATSALDAESESVVQAALERLMEGRTTVIVAHRLSTVIDADAIAVVKQGRVVELGTHAELLEVDGAYATLVHMQQQLGNHPETTHFNTKKAAKNVHSTNLSPAMDVAPRSAPDESPLSSNKYNADNNKSSLYMMADVVSTVGDAMETVNVTGVPTVGATPAVPMHATRGFRKYLSLRRKRADADHVGMAHANKMQPLDGLTLDVQASRKKKRWMRLFPSSSKHGGNHKKSDDDDDDGATAKVATSRLAELNKPELPVALGGLAGSIVMGMLFPIFSIAFSSLIAVFYRPADEVQDGVRTWSLVFAGIGFACLIAAFVQSFCFNFMGQRLAKRVRVLMMRALLRQEVGWYDDERNSSGILASKLSADALAVKGQFGDTMGLVTQNIVTLLAGYIIAGINSWRMMLVVTAVFPLVVFSVTLQTEFVLAAGFHEEQVFAEANQTASEAFTSIRTVQAFGMHDEVSRLYGNQLQAPTKDSRKRANWAGAGLGFSQFVMFGINSLAFWYMGLDISRGYSSFEEAFKAFFAIFLAAYGVAQAQAYFPDVAKGRAAVRRVFAVIDRRPVIDAADPCGVRPVTCKGEIALRKVTFAYPSRPEAPVFVDFSLVVPAGKTVALVGESGSGKSTVIQLIERFYDPQAGVVLLDGVDLREMNLQWLRSQVGLVSQEPVLFSMSVADNIRYGNPEASLEAAVAAAKAANADGFVSALPEGYHTRLGEGAIQLSGGQTQRVAIARALLKDPRVLLLDEATSALDAESEHVVQTALRELMRGRTTLIVAHRLSTIEHADSIAVVYKGRIVEQGQHSDLVSAGGAYARLVAHQLTP